MNRSGWRPRLVALVTAILACVGLLSLSTAPAWAKAGTITEFPPSTRLGGPGFITAGPDGNLWFTLAQGNQIGRITSSGAITEFPIPTAGSTPEGITTGPDGNLWFAEELGNQIGRITTSGNFTEFPVPTKSSDPFSITAGPDGNLWFTEGGGNKIGRITTGSSFTEFPFQRPVGPLVAARLRASRPGPMATSGSPILVGTTLDASRPAAASPFSPSPRSIVTLLTSQPDRMATSGSLRRMRARLGASPRSSA